MTGSFSTFDAYAAISAGLVGAVRPAPMPARADRFEASVALTGALSKRGEAQGIARGTDTFTLSATASTPAVGSTAASRDQEQQRDARSAPGVEDADTENRAGISVTGDEELTDEQQDEVETLQSTDREVRQHEQAHVAAAGALFIGGPYYDYTTGPDGKRYVVGGRVDIDTSEGDTPEETISRALQIQRAALAPAEPSSQDRAVAADAAQMESRARAELTEEMLAERTNNGENASEVVGKQQDDVWGENTNSQFENAAPTNSATPSLIGGIVDKLA